MNGYKIPFEELLKCSICQGLIKDARSLPCGHTYCKGCLVRSADATYPRGSIKCSECQNITQVPCGGAEGLPRCFAINSLVDDINQTFGGGGGTTSSRRSSTSNGREEPLSLSRHGFQVRETFQCSFCLSLMTDARYLPCGHSFCRGCLTMQPRSTLGIRCTKCLKDHNLPPQGINGLPAAYRINSIVDEIRSNDNGASDEPQATSSKKNRYQPPLHGQSPDSSSRPLMEDVDEAKKMAQAQAQVQAGNHSQSPDTRSRPSMEDVDEIKKRAKAQAQVRTDGTSTRGNRVSSPYRFGPTNTTNTQFKSGQIQIQARDLSGKTHMVWVNSKDKVRDLNVKIREKVGMDTSQLQLNFQGKILEERSTCNLHSLGIRNLSTVQLQGRMIGGGLFHKITA